MPTVKPEECFTFSSKEALGNWLAANHASASELGIKLFKKHSAIASVSWDEVVIESLCWGWIDGIKKSLDEQAYLQRISPRKARSVWSKRNRAHVERLIDQGRMQPAGLQQVLAAKADGRWAQAYAASEIEVPTDFIQALESNQTAKAFFATLTKSKRFVIAHGLNSAKRAPTRQKRFDQYMGQLAHEQKPS